MTPLTLNERRALQSIGRFQSRAARNGPRREASPGSNPLMDRILKKLRSTPEEKMLKRISCLPKIRHGKVINLCRQIRQGIYSVEDGLGSAIERALDDIAAT